MTSARIRVPAAKWYLSASTAVDRRIAPRSVNTKCDESGTGSTLADARNNG